MINALFLKLVAWFRNVGDTKEIEEDRGLEVWLSLNKNLPPSTDIFTKDSSRLSSFSKQVIELSSQEQNDLKAWLYSQVQDLAYPSTEFLTTDEEDEREKLKQIYKKHLAAI